jgi:hypothetical protein
MVMARRNALGTAGVMAVLALCGCLQIDTLIKLHEDGSATITEKVRFSRRLLDLSGAPGSDNDIAGLLSKEAAQARVKHLGKGCTLVSYNVADAEGGSKEAVAVYKIEDITELRYVSPFLAYKDYDSNNAVKVAIRPKLSHDQMGAAGVLLLELQPLKRPVEHPQLKLKPGEKPPPGPSPRSLQMARDLGPMFKDMLTDFKLKLTFESYDKLRSAFGIRGADAATKSIDFINITDKDLDRYGNNFFENEEILLELVQGKVNGDSIAANLTGWTKNLTVPVFHNWGSGSPERPWRPGNDVSFRPSKALFDKYFEGKMLTVRVDYNTSATKPAKFEDIGFKPEK